ncbi:MAG: glycosyltransferase [Acidimicrobiales bacterium]
MAEPTWAIVAGGGTAGHLLPGVAVARALVDAGHDPATIHFVGAERGPEATLVPEAGFTVDVLPGRGIQRWLALANVGAVLDLVRALVQGIGIVRRRRPAVVVVLGGYASFACGVGAVLSRVPLVLLEQNRRAGAVNRALRRFAAAAAVSFEGTDLPRHRHRQPAPARDPHRRRAPRSGALASRARPAGRPHGHRRLLRVAGLAPHQRRGPRARGPLGRSQRPRRAPRHRPLRLLGRARRPPELPEGGLAYQVVDYEDRMHLLLDAADVGVTRGRGVFELMATGLPAVLVPLPIATRDHQTANARAVEALGGAVVVPDAELDVDRLERELGALLDDRARLAAMSTAMRSGALVDAAERAAQVVEGAARG